MGPCNQKNCIVKKLCRPFILLFSILFSAFSFYANGQSRFTFVENAQGIELLEQGQPVYFYQRAPKSVDGRYICNNYLHPLFSIDGDTLTDEFPEDHPYHRGIYWAWHQIYIDNKSIGDGWIMENFSEDVTDIHSGVQNKMARLDLEVEWNSSQFQNGKTFILENTTIWVHPLSEDIRLIDFEIRLKALVPGISIGGSDDEKGYGGFCARIKLPHDLIFTSTNGPVIPQTLQIQAGQWMDFSGSFDKNKKISGMSILSLPDFLNYPVHWILRKETAMQNIVFPGRQRINLSLNNPIVLKYRVAIHRGNAKEANINKLQKRYNKFSYPDSITQIK
jgi:Methane oxygenase PmoA